MNDNTITVIPTTLGSRLRIKEDRKIDNKIRNIIIRWLQRAARRQKKFINEPSLHLEISYNPVFELGQKYLYAFVDAAPDTAPAFLRYAKVERKWIRIANLNDPPQVNCPGCNGSGEFTVPSPCPDCNGEGKVSPEDAKRISEWLAAFN